MRFGPNYHNSAIWTNLDCWIISRVKRSYIQIDLFRILSRFHLKFNMSVSTFVFFLHDYNQYWTSSVMVPVSMKWNVLTGTQSIQNETIFVANWSEQNFQPMHMSIQFDSPASTLNAAGEFLMLWRCLSLSQLQTLQQQICPELGQSHTSATASYWLPRLIKGKFSSRILQQDKTFRMSASMATIVLNMGRSADIWIVHDQLFSGYIL